jgi:hypothetical protein
MYKILGLLYSVLTAAKWARRATIHTMLQATAMQLLFGGRDVVLNFTVPSKLEIHKGKKRKAYTY